jgi:rare lipoprotein A (peptidoglycan hydrolase)
VTNLSATTRGVVAALVAVLLVLPAAALSADGSAGSNNGGGVTYYETSEAENDQIALVVRRGAWLGRSIRIRGTAEELAGHTVAIERRSSNRKSWAPLQEVPVAEDGTFEASWKPGSSGRHQLRAVVTNASTAAGTDARVASAVRRVTVYRRVMATWYGPGFYGNRTACGQRLTTRTLGVAHKTLPCGAKVSVRYGGRSITVPVIDRGPYADGISYDLTSATAEALGVTHTVRIGAAVLSR